MTLHEVLSEASQDDVIGIDGNNYQVLRAEDGIVYLDGYNGHTLKATVNREVTIELMNPDVSSGFVSMVEGRVEEAED